MKIELGKRYISDGSEGVVISTTRNDSVYPVVFLRDDGTIMCFKSDGQYWEDELDTNFDLQEIPKSRWLNVYDGLAFTFSSRKEADDAAKTMTTVRLACVEVKEGDGL